MGMVDGGALVGKALANEGVEKAFVLCGGHIMPIFYGMRNAGIEIIDMRHECAAIYAAIAYTRASGKAAVVVTTAGPGVGNTPAGHDGGGVVGHPPSSDWRCGSDGMRDTGDLQDMSTLNVMETCSKWARKSQAQPNRIPEYVSMAFRHAMDSTPGPVYLEIPTDLCLLKLWRRGVNFPANYRTRAIPYGDPALIDSAAELLVNAERPAVVVDDGARFWYRRSRGGGCGAFRLFEDAGGCTGHSCRGLFGDEYENPLLRMNAARGWRMWSWPWVAGLISGWDRAGGSPGMRRSFKCIRIMRQIGFNLRADIGIVGGAGPVAGQLLEAVKSKREKPADAPWTGPAKEKRRFEPRPNRIKRRGFPAIPDVVRVRWQDSSRKKAGTGPDL